MYVPTTSATTDINVSFIQPSQYDTEEVITFHISKTTLDASKGSWQKYTLPVTISSAPSQIKITFLANDTTSENTYYNFYFDEFYASGMNSSVILQNISEVNYSKTGTIASIKNFPILSNPSIAVRTISSLIPDNENTTGTLETDATGKIDIPILSLNGTIGVLFPKPEIKTASHTIQTRGDTVLFSYIYLNENYIFKPLYNNAEKENIISISLAPINVPFSLKAATKGILNTQNSIQKTEAMLNLSLGNNIKWNSNFIWTNGQKIIGANNLFTSYGNSWYDTSKIQFSTGSSSAQERSISLATMQQVIFPVAGIAPSVSLLGTNLYTNTNLIENTPGMYFSVNFPFDIKKNSFNIGIYRQATPSITKNSEYANNSSYKTDIMSFINNCNGFIPIFTSIPFYELFSNSIETSIFNTLKTMVANRLIFIQSERIECFSM